jgi:hypothetical protein
MKKIKAEASEPKGLAVLVASHVSSYVTGQIFVEDGGQVSHVID